MCLPAWIILWFWLCTHLTLYRKCGNVLYVMDTEKDWSFRMAHNLFLHLWFFWNFHMWITASGEKKKTNKPTFFKEAIFHTLSQCMHWKIFDLVTVTRKVSIHPNQLKFSIPSYTGFLIKGIVEACSLTFCQAIYWFLYIYSMFHIGKQV